MADAAAGDRRFKALARAAAALVLVLLGAIAAFLAVQAWPAIETAGASFLTRRDWFPDAAPPVFGIAALVFGTVASSLLALLLALPVGIGAALFLTELASPRLGRWGGHLLDLLAAVPSVVYGLWGFVVLVPALVPVQRGLDRTVGQVVPLLHSRTGAYGRSIFAAGVVLAIMVLPIIAALARELFRQTPRAQREGALALGATRWEAIRLAVLPFSRAGLVGAAMLGLGRALGETIAVALVLSPAFVVNLHLVEPGGNTIAANIAVKFGEAGAMGRSALIASGLVLFALTLGVNVVARAMVHRSVRVAEAKP